MTIQLGASLVQNQLFCDILCSTAPTRGGGYGRSSQGSQVATLGFLWEKVLSRLKWSSVPKNRGHLKWNQSHCHMLRNCDLSSVRNGNISYTANIRCCFLRFSWGWFLAAARASLRWLLPGGGGRRLLGCSCQGALLLGFL